MSDRLAVLPQYLIPKQAITMLAGKLASAQAGGLTTSVIRWFVGRYGVNMAEAEQPDPAAYACFNDFFTRALRAGARPLADADFLCPVDGAISQFGRIERDQVFQAKGHHYSTTALVGGDAALAEDNQALAMAGGVTPFAATGEQANRMAEFNNRLLPADPAREVLAPGDGLVVGNRSLYLDRGGVFPEGVKVIVVDRDVDFTVISAEASRAVDVGALEGKAALSPALGES